MPLVARSSCYTQFKPYPVHLIYLLHCPKCTRNVNKQHHTIGVAYIALDLLRMSSSGSRILLNIIYL